MARKRPPTNPKALDRDAYAMARAQGKPKAEAARLAGSRAKRSETLTKQGIRLEREDGMYQRIAVAREMVIRGIEDEWEKACARMGQLLDHPDWKARAKSADFFAKVTGGYAPTKVEHSGGIETDAVGALGELSPEARRELREILKREAERKQR